MTICKHCNQRIKTDKVVRPRKDKANLNVVGGSAGLSMRPQFNPGASLSVAGGYNYNNFSFELELKNSLNRISSENNNLFATHSGGKSVLQSMLFANAYYNIPKEFVVAGKTLVPYVGGGIGLLCANRSSGGVLRFNNVGIIGDKIHSAIPFQLIGGAKVMLNEKITLTGSLALQNVLDKHFNTSNYNDLTHIRFGANYNL